MKKLLVFLAGMFVATNLLFGDELDEIVQKPDCPKSMSKEDLMYLFYHDKALYPENKGDDFLIRGKLSLKNFTQVPYLPFANEWKTQSFLQLTQGPSEVVGAYVCGYEFHFTHPAPIGVMRWTQFVTSKVIN